MLCQLIVLESNGIGKLSHGYDIYNFKLTLLADLALGNNGLVLLSLHSFYVNTLHYIKFTLNCMYVHTYKRLLITYTIGRSAQAL